MGKTILPWFGALSFLALLIFVSFFHVQRVSSATNHIVISEVQIVGASASADFVEIYNPTNSEINLGTYRIVKRTDVGSVDNGIISFSVNDKISAHGYWLWCSNEADPSVTCDRRNGNNIGNN